jgi:cytochrome c oxidase subunit 2
MRFARVTGLLAASATALTSFAAAAQDVGSGKPVPGGLGFQEPVTQIAEDIQWLHNVFLLPILTIICLLVVGLLAGGVIKYNAKANPEPARFTHHALLEVAWTVVPIIILVAMIPPSLQLLYEQETPPEADIVIKATGNQWYWGYEYPDEAIAFDAYMIGQDATGLTDEVRQELVDAGYQEDEYLLATDTQVVVPVGANVLVQVVGGDVIHAWTIPAFGSKVDAMPGRINQTWFNATKTGRYFGQCSELCGKFHAYMPIVVDVVTEEEYAEWLAFAREEYAMSPAGEQRGADVAANAAADPAISTQ